MRILVSGGFKTHNIIDGINRKFQSNGIEFLEVKYIEDIEAIYARGEYFDRAVIMEQSWTRDLSNTDRDSIRSKINAFAFDSARRKKAGTTFIFMSRDVEMAEIVYEETLSIRSESLSMYKTDNKFFADFFIELFQKDLKDMDENLIFRPNLDYSMEDTDIIENEGLEGNTYNAKPKSLKDLDIESGIEAEIDPALLEVKEEVIEEETEVIGGIEDVPQDDEYMTPIPTIEDDTKDETADLPEFESDPSDYVALPGVTDFENPKPQFKELDQDFINPGMGIVPEFQPNNGLDDLPDEEIEYDPETGESEFINKESEGEYDTDEDKEEYDIAEEDADNYTEDYGPDGLPIEDEIDTDAELGDEPDEITDSGDENFMTNDLHPSRPKAFKSVEAPTGVKELFDSFAKRGNSIAVTGFGGSGTSSVAFHLANTIANIGYDVLLVDLDTEYKTQSYISSDAYDSIGIEDSNVISAINSSGGAAQYASIVKPGFRLLTMGLGSDAVAVEDIINKEKLARFATMAKTMSQFIVYDIPFKDAVESAAPIIYTADNLVINIGTSNWGITKALVGIGNIESEDFEDCLFSRGQLLFNRYAGMNRLFGNKINKLDNIPKLMDKQMLELIGRDTGLNFKDMNIAGLINEDSKFEYGWYEKVQYSDTVEGMNMFIELLKNIMLRRG